MSRPIPTLLVFAAFFVAGCVAPVPMYTPPTSGRSASISFETTVTVSTRHAYVADSGTCADRGKVQSPGEFRVPAGKKVLIQQGFFSNWAVYTQHCNLALTFTPIPGERYVSSYRMNGETQRCQMEISRINPDGTRSPEPSAVKVSSCPEH